MQTISDELKASLAKKNPTYKKVVELHRRLWSGGVYIYDTEIDVTNQVKQYGSVRWKFDNEDFNTWTLDNTSLVFRNDRNQWKQDNVKGYFPDPYLIAESKIVIKFGAELADGTFEVIKSFTGYIAGDPIMDPSGKSVTVTIQGGMAAFGKKSAEEISTLVTDELLGEDAGTEFTTANNGVGIIVIVKRGVSLAAATEIKPITNYTASDLKEKALPLKITLVTDLTAGEKLYCSYRYWYQDKLLEWLVEQVMILCGVASYSIAPAVFYSSAETTWDLNSQADWNTCTLSNIDTITTPGSFKVGLIDDFGDGNYNANPTWTVVSSAGGTWDASSGILYIDTQPVSAITDKIKLPSVRATGNWQFKAWSESPNPIYNTVIFYIMADEPAGGLVAVQNGYGLSIQRSPTYNWIRFFKVVAGVITTLKDIAVIPSSTSVYRISRVAGGTFEIFIDEVSQGTVSDNTVTTSAYMLCEVYTDDRMRAFFDDIYYWEDGTTPGIGVLTSPAHGAIVNLTSWGKLAATYTVNGATVLIETSVWNGGGWDAWTAIDGSGQILSTAYVTTDIKFRVTGTLASLVALATPVFDQMTVTYYTSTVLIDLVDLTGMTCKQVVERCAEMPAYEIGFKADETFVYRPRFTTVPPVIDLRSDTNVENISNITDGVERVKNRVVAEFGIYRVVADASADAHPNSIDKYEMREYPVSSSTLLPAQNVNIAYAIAPTILTYTKTPRKRCTVSAMFLPHLELGDKATLYFNEPTALLRWLWGDTDVAYGEANLEYYDEIILANRYNFWGVTMRIEGIELDPNTFRTKFNLVEVI